MPNPVKNNLSVLGLLAALCLLMVSASAQETTPPIEPSPALQAHLQSLEDVTSRIRGLPARTPVLRFFPSRADVAAFLAGQLEDEQTVRTILEGELIYKAFGLLPRDIDLLQTYLVLLESQIGGYYDPDTKRMNTVLISTSEVGDRLPLLESIVYVHEYTHALQDQYYDLGALLSDELIADHPDAAIAIQALVEGDATQVMTDFVQDLTESDPQAVLNEMGALLAMSSSLEIPPGTPDILTQELLFPYTQGQLFVQALIAQGGYAAVDAAYLNPPVSTEQIINPQKYLDGELPIAVTLDSAQVVLGAGWSLAAERTGGEFFLRSWLKPGLGSLNTATAADGWGGDRYRVYQQEDGATAWRWRIVFDSPKDVQQMSDLLPRGLNRLYGQPVSEGCWQLAEDGESLCFVVEDPDSGVLLAQAPTLALAQNLLKP